MFRKTLFTYRAYQKQTMRRLCGDSKTIRARDFAQTTFKFMNMNLIIEITEIADFTLFNI